MLLQPLSDACHSAFVRIGRRVGPVKYPNFLKEDHGDTTTLSFADLGAQFFEKRFDISPLNIAAGGPGEDQFEGALVLSPHAPMVPESGTEWVEQLAQDVE
jgi:hypothetical protein